MTSTSFQRMGHTCEAQTWPKAEEGSDSSTCPAERCKNKFTVSSALRNDSNVLGLGVRCQRPARPKQVSSSVGAFDLRHADLVLPEERHNAPSESASNRN